MADTPPLFEVRNLETHFDRSSGIIQQFIHGKSEKIQAVDGVSFTLEAEDSIGIIGESGCGKTTLLMTLLGLEDPTGGQMKFKGEDVTDYSRSDWKRFRREVQVIFQDPFNSLDPKMTVRETLMEPLRIHGFEDKETRIKETLEQVELKPPEKYMNRLPKQLSGGEKQRVAIARALVIEPSVILADEPVSMLDVSTQASILNMLADLIEDIGVAMIYVSHDLSTVSYVCQHIHVMYLGRVVENGPVKSLINEQYHPYTKALFQAVPIPDPHPDRARTEIEKSPREPVNLGEGCRFRDRCLERMDVCEHTPRNVQMDEETTVACHLYYDHEDHATVDDPTRANRIPGSTDGDRAPHSETREGTTEPPTAVETEEND
jgi:peptide/nickel transport system ATP-binding protein